MDQLQGVYTTLAEYTSREARYNLVLACLDQLTEDAQRSNVAATQALAGCLHVSQRTIQRWGSGGVQSCNVNAEAIINASLTLVPEVAAEILAKDLEEHRRQLEASIPANPEDPALCPWCGKVSPNPRYCTSCGKPIEEDMSLRETREAQQDAEDGIMNNPHLRAAAVDVIRSSGGASSAEIGAQLELSSYETMLVVEGALKAGVIVSDPDPGSLDWLPAPDPEQPMEAVVA